MCKSSKSFEFFRAEWMRKKKQQQQNTRTEHWYESPSTIITKSHKHRCHKQRTHTHPNAHKWNRMKVIEIRKLLCNRVSGKIQFISRESQNMSVTLHWAHFQRQTEILSMFRAIRIVFCVTKQKNIRKMGFQWWNTMYSLIHSFPSLSRSLSLRLPMARVILYKFQFSYCLRQRAIKNVHHILFAYFMRAIPNCTAKWKTIKYSQYVIYSRLDWWIVSLSLSLVLVLAARSRSPYRQRDLVLVHDFYSILANISLSSSSLWPNAEWTMSIGLVTLCKSQHRGFNNMIKND